MSLNKAKYHLKDGSGIVVGLVEIEKAIGQTWVGEFIESDEFSKYAPLFLEHESYVEDQIFPLSDEVEKKIDNLSFSIKEISGKNPDIRVFDLQIMHGRVSFKI
jgi:hypothetical protein